MQIELHLSGLMAGWSDSLRLQYRRTNQTPHRSAIAGLIGAAMGIPRGGDLSFLDDVEISIHSANDEVDKLTDFQTIRNAVTYDGKPGRNIVTHRQYLIEPTVTVAIAGDSAIVERIAAALWQPHWQLCLGRRNCVPTQPLTHKPAKMAETTAQ